MAEVNRLSQKEEIKITPLSQRVLDNIDAIPNMLTELENNVLKIILEHPALTTKEIRRFYGFYQAEEIYHKKWKSFSIEEFNKVEELLKDKKVIPAFETIDKILQSLEKLGLVGRRYDPLKKAKWLWIVNPKYLIALKERKLVK